jgi:diguanylate cyclase
VRQLSPPRRAVVVALLTLLLAGFAGFCAFVGPGLGAGRLDTFFNAYVYNALVLLSALACLLRAAWVGTERRAWAVVGLAMLSWSGGEIYWSAHLAELGDAAPYPSPADGFYLLFYPLVYVGLVLLLRRHARRFPSSLWLDGGIAALAVGALGAALVVPPVLAASEGELATVATNIAYPLADVVLLMLVVAIFALTGWRPGRAWALIGAAFALTAVADSLFLVQTATDVYEEGTLLDALWPAGATLLALAAWQRPRDPAAVRLEGWGVLLAPLAFALGALGVLVANDFAPVGPVALSLAAATIVAAGVRTALTFREVRLLADSRRLALTDDLTGLANRRRFFDLLGEAVGDAHRTGASTGVAILDLDGFKEVNDALGHPAGDRILAEVGPRLRAALPERATAARLGGDEFAALLPTGTDADAAAAIAADIRAAFEQPFDLGSVSVTVGASVGAALCPEHAPDAEGLLRRADIAMYEAKTANLGFKVYVHGHDRGRRDRLLFAEGLRTGIGRGELILHYQPQARLDTGAVTSVEALVRWRHPERGLLAPAEFVPLAEQTDLIGPLTSAVLDGALRQLEAWRRQGRDLEVAVNVSIANLLDVDFPDAVARAIGRRAVPPERVRLEVTESLVLADPVRAIDVLARLGELGVGLSLDDFGTGHASLAYLKRMPVDELKIDRAFVSGMAGDSGDAAIVRASLDLARTFGLRTVAEGVETPETWDALRALGCDLAQGFVLSRPLPPHELVSWLARRDEEPAAPAGTGPDLGAATMSPVAGPDV